MDLSQIAMDPPGYILWDDAEEIRFLYLATELEANGEARAGQLIREWVRGTNKIHDRPYASSAENDSD